MVRSLLVCIYELGIKEILVIGHHECGMAKTTSASMTQAMLNRGVAPEAIHMIARELKEWADEFQHPEENVEITVDQLRLNPLIPKDVPVHGLMFHPRSGRLKNWSPARPKPDLCGKVYHPNLLFHPSNYTRLCNYHQAILLR